MEGDLLVGRHFTYALEDINQGEVNRGENLIGAEVRGQVSTVKGDKEEDNGDGIDPVGNLLWRRGHRQLKVDATISTYLSTYVLTCDKRVCRYSFHEASSCVSPPLGPGEEDEAPLVVLLLALFDDDDDEDEDDCC